MALKVVGTRQKRYDGLAHVTGETRFVDDVFVPGTLAVKVLRSPIVKGRVKNLDTTAAERLAGVAGVITPADVPVNGYGLIPDQPVLAESIRYKGEPIAAVAAVDEDTALEALDLIHVDIDAQEAVFDPLEAMKPDAPRVRPEGNILMFGERNFRQVVLGDIEAGFKEADHVIEGEYFHPALEHAQLEPQTSLAVPEANGKLTIYTVSQALYFHLGMLAGILHMKPDDLRCVCKWAGRTRSSWRGSIGLSDIKYVGGTVGGGFGGKNDIHADHVTAILALKTGRPVKWRWTREEELLYSTYRGAWIIKIKDGVRNDGRMVARQVESIRDAGAYTSMNSYVVDKHCFLVNGPYHVPNIYIKGYCVYTNKPPSSSMRGFGVTPATFATEVQMDKIAEAVGLSPWEVRFINAVRNGDQTATRRKLDSVYLIETMQTLAKRAGVVLPEKLQAMTSAERGA
ncbi:MAG: xanthine dehydrogenase family protein molybdopterin-binding subunit [Desulfobacterales bacterium]|nr:MAG: xanthine dehydrogenase family protein molybdopterin-binding subunit [Desulfobacterales bacterium]